LGIGVASSKSSVRARNNDDAILAFAVDPDKGHPAEAGNDSDFFDIDVIRHEGLSKFLGEGILADAADHVN
jgi:hypothetical protein